MLELGSNQQESNNWNLINKQKSRVAEKVGDHSNMQLKIGIHQHAGTPRNMILYVLKTSNIQQMAAMTPFVEEGLTFIYGIPGSYK